MDAIAVKFNIYSSLYRSWFCVQIQWVISLIFPFIALDGCNLYAPRYLILFLFTYLYFHFPCLFFSVILFIFFCFHLTPCLLLSFCFLSPCLSFYLCLLACVSCDRWSHGGISQVKMTGTDRPTEDTMGKASTNFRCCHTSIHTHL